MHVCVCARTHTQPLAPLAELLLLPLPQALEGMAGGGGGRGGRASLEPLPAGLASCLQGLVEVRLAGCGLTTLPAALLPLPGLQLLDVSFNSLSALPLPAPPPLLPAARGAADPMAQPLACSSPLQGAAAALELELELARRPAVAGSVPVAVPVPVAVAVPMPMPTSPASSAAAGQGSGSGSGSGSSTSPSSSSGSSGSAGLRAAVTSPGRWLGAVREPDAAHHRRPAGPPAAAWAGTLLSLNIASNRFSSLPPGLAACSRLRELVLGSPLLGRLGEGELARCCSTLPALRRLEVRGGSYEPRAVQQLLALQLRAAAAGRGGLQVQVAPF